MIDKIKWIKKIEEWIFKMMMMEALKWLELWDYEKAFISKQTVDIVYTDKIFSTISKEYMHYVINWQGPGKNNFF